MDPNFDGSATSSKFSKKRRWAHSEQSSLIRKELTRHLVLWILMNAPAENSSEASQPAYVAENRKVFKTF